MSILTNLPDNYNLLSPISFKAVFRKLPTIEYFCQSINIPGVSVGEAARATPFINFSQPGDSIRFDDLSITFLVDEEMKNYLELVTWLRGIGSPSDPKKERAVLERDRSASQYSGLYTDCSITLLTNNMNANKIINFIDCWPNSVSALQLSSTEGDVSAITSTATFKYRDFQIENVT
tara:strand:+ start:423 stop:953 length:531 start_codon:yes stop_codon:yes gene_type:complete